MDLSVVIVSYNTKELLENCLKSLEKATKNLKTEVFVSDNNSQDSTQEFVKKNFPDVKLLANKNNVGFSKANNIAIKKTTGRYVLILNPDTKVLPDTLTTMKKFMDSAKKDVAISTCRVELESGKLDPDCKRGFPTPWRAFSHFTGLSKIFAKTKLFDSYYLGYLDEKSENQIESCEGAFMFARSEIFTEVGMFDEDYFFYGEDIDLCYRVNKAGYKIVYTPIAKIIHVKGGASGIKKHSEHISKSTKESKIVALKESTRAMKLFYEKHYRKKYPFFVTGMMYLGIWLVERRRLATA